MLFCITICPMLSVCVAEWLRRALLAPQESGGPGSNPGADTEDQTVKLVAISSQWVTAGEYCKVNRRSEKHWPRSQTKRGVHPHCGLRALEWR